MKKGIVMQMAKRLFRLAPPQVVAIGVMALLTGCGHSADQAANTPATPKWKGAPYRISFDAPPAKPNPSGLTIPPIKFTANPDALETRATLIVRFDVVGDSKTPMINQLIMAPFSISGADGKVPPDVLESADTQLANLMGGYCVKGKIKVTLALAQSSLNPQGAAAEIDSKRLSDWQTVETVFKNPHPKC